MPRIALHRIRYFTAMVKSTPDDPHKAQRQRFYLRALETIENLTVHYGVFLRTKVRMRLVSPKESGEQFTRVWRTEEKGSDVNLATFLMLDAFRNDFDQAIVVSNDSDLIEPIRVAKDEFGRTTGVFNPRPKTPSKEIHDIASFVRDIHQSDAAASQFPDQLLDRNGRVIRRPPQWAVSSPGAGL